MASKGKKEHNFALFLSDGFYHSRIIQDILSVTRSATTGAFLSGHPPYRPIIVQEKLVLSIIF
jgi:hypothetical protein